MLTPKFNVTKKDKVFIGVKYICGGHWLLTRDAIRSHAAPKTLKNLLPIETGAYAMGIEAGITGENPDFDHVIPKREGYTLIDPAPVGVVFSSEMNISAYKFVSGEKQIGVAVNYVPLFLMGQAFMKDALSPVLILMGSSLNDELVGVVMPMRL